MDKPDPHDFLKRKADHQDVTELKEKNPSGGRKPSEDKAPTPKKHEFPTDLAKKYGIGKWEYWKLRKKSGLTPLSPLPSPSVSVSEEKRFHVREIQSKQRKNLKGFTARELEDLSCINAPDVVLSDPELSAFPVHEIYDRTRWRSNPSDPLIERGFEGRWNAKNDVVWNALLPSLKLASLFLKNQESFGWFDGLTCGVRKQIPSLSSSQNRVYKFYARSAESIRKDLENPENYKGINYVTTNFESKLRFRLDDLKYRKGEGGVNIGPHGGIRQYDQKNGNIVVICLIHTRLVEPLLREDLSAAERIVQQFRLAKTILHETAHGIEILVNKHLTKFQSKSEPFFEEERVAELGYSMEKSLFGGRVNSLIDHRLDAIHTAENSLWPPVMGLFLSSFPDYKIVDRLLSGKHHLRQKKGTSNPTRNYVYKSNEFQDDPTQGREVSYENWPIPIRWSENFHQADFWNIGIRSGKHNFRIPHIYGLKGTRKQKTLIVGRDYMDAGKHMTMNIYADEPWDLKIPPQFPVDDEDLIRRLSVRMALRNAADERQLNTWDEKPWLFQHFPLPKDKWTLNTGPIRKLTKSGGVNAQKGTSSKRRSSSDGDSFRGQQEELNTGRPGGKKAFEHNKALSTSLSTSGSKRRREAESEEDEPTQKHFKKQDNTPNISKNQLHSERSSNPYIDDRGKARNRQEDIDSSEDVNNTRRSEIKIGWDSAYSRREYPRDDRASRKLTYSPPRDKSRTAQSSKRSPSQSRCHSPNIQRGRNQSNSMTISRKPTYSPPPRTSRIAQSPRRSPYESPSRSRYKEIRKSPHSYERRYSPPPSHHPRSKPTQSSRRSQDRRSSSPEPQHRRDTNQILSDKITSSHKPTYASPHRPNLTYSPPQYKSRSAQSAQRSPPSRLDRQYYSTNTQHRGSSPNYTEQKGRQWIGQRREHEGDYYRPRPRSPPHPQSRGRSRSRDGYNYKMRPRPRSRSRDGHYRYSTAARSGRRSRSRSTPKVYKRRR